MISHEHYSAHKDNTSVEQKVIRYSMQVSILMSMIRFFFWIEIGMKAIIQYGLGFEGLCKHKNKKIIDYIQCGLRFQGYISIKHKF